jgi:hypothetical protein
MYNIHSNYSAPESSFMSFDPKNNERTDEKSKPRRKAESAPSDGKLTAVQREARLHYQPGTESRAKTGSFDSGSEHAALRESAEAITVNKLLSDASIGIRHARGFQGNIQRSIAGSGNRYMLGTEFAIVAIVAIAGIAKRRADLSDAQMKALIGGEGLANDPEFRGKVIYNSREHSRGALPRAQLEDGLQKRFGFEAGKDKMKHQHGMTKDVPEWLVSLDNSVAKEAGYLFGSVLRRPTVLMTMSDTFVSLAEHHFYDATLSWLIVDLNARKVNEIWKGNTKVVAVRNGETIELPVWEDIVEFYQNKPKLAKPDNLLTVVLKRNLDRELIEAALASIVGPGVAQVEEIRAEDGDGALEYRVTIRGARLRIHRIFYENLNSWHKMVMRLQLGLVSRFL